MLSITENELLQVVTKVFSENEKIISNSKESCKKITKDLLTELKGFFIENTIKYTTGEVAKAIGVSIQTIHNWINSGKITGIEKEENKQIRIPETAIYSGTKGAIITIKEIMDEYNKSLNTSDDDYLKELQRQADSYSKKFVNIDLLRKKENKTDVEERILSEWEYCLNEIKELNLNE